MPPMSTAPRVFDEVSSIVIERFNAAEITYGRRSKHSYPVSREDVLGDPVCGGGPRPATECRSLIAYILANHIPLWDEFRQASRLPTYMALAGYLNCSVTAPGKMIRTACRLMADPQYKRVYVGSLLRMATDQIETWNIGKPARKGDCE